VSALATFRTAGTIWFGEGAARQIGEACKLKNPDLYGKLEPYHLPTEFVIRESCKPVE